MPWAGNIAKTMTSNGEHFTVTREMLTAVARDRWNLSAVFKLCFESGNKIHCSPRDQSLSVKCFPRVWFWQESKMTVWIKLKKKRFVWTLSLFQAGGGGEGGWGFQVFRLWRLPQQSISPTNYPLPFPRPLIKNKPYRDLAPEKKYCGESWRGKKFFQAEKVPSLHHFSNDPSLNHNGTVES